MCQEMLTLFLPLFLIVIPDTEKDLFFPKIDNTLIGPCPVGIVVLTE